MQANDEKNTVNKDPLVGFDLDEGKEHTHKGESCVPGVPVTMRKAQADKLMSSGVGKIVPAPESK